ncbi:hypothetical protein GCM10008905_16140 [Clostridium malenominatum]|uniref:Uncharacterized protein n=1 Tax=Clostridium malenominatum TaxID=1539 RepID=A0ABN1IXM3_9CLOT
MEKQRKTEVYKILILKKQLERDSSEYVLQELKEEIILKEFLDYFFIFNKYDEKKGNKYTINSKDICYYIDRVDECKCIKKVRLKYIKFNKRTNIVDIQTLKPNYKKNKNEGDEEKQHYLVKIFEDKNRAVLIWEKIVGAVTTGILEKDINRSYRKWVKEHKKDKKDLLLQYDLNIEVVPSPKFIEELMKLDKISLIKIVVDKESLTDDEEIIFSEEHISKDEVEVLYKPIQSRSFSKTKVRSYYKQFENQTGKKKIIRMVIQGRKDANVIRLDTEGMKLSEYINTKIDSDGLIDTESIFEKYTELVNKNFKEYFNNIFIEIDESEE